MTQQVCIGHMQVLWNSCSLFSAQQLRKLIIQAVNVCIWGLYSGATQRKQRAKKKEENPAQTWRFFDSNRDRDRDSPRQHLCKFLNLCTLIQPSFSKPSGAGNRFSFDWRELAGTYIGRVPRNVRKFCHRSLNLVPKWNLVGHFFLVTLFCYPREPWSLWSDRSTRTTPANVTFRGFWR